MNSLFFSSFLVLFAISGYAQVKPKLPLEVVSEVDLNLYMGTWYEIARLPNWFEKNARAM
jgi:apolipoprotein D and lipocalin family protein